MPNWVKNILEISGNPKSVKKVANFMEGTDNEGRKNCFDFNKLIPMPEDLLIESGSVSKLSLLVYRYKIYGLETENLLRCRSFDEEDMKLSLEDYVAKLISGKYVDLDLGRKVYENLLKYGFADWYDWRINKWGTKWNACDAICQKEDANLIRFEFDTAWGAPLPVIEKLSQRFPAVKVHHLWADENIGYNTGEDFYANNQVEHNFHEDCSSEAYRIYTCCWGESECIKTDSDGNYYARDCAECKGCL